MDNPNFVDRCERCQWYRNDVCHRKPPTVFKIDGYFIDGVERHHYFNAIWPYVEKTDYCGEFHKITKKKEG